MGLEDGRWLKETLLLYALSRFEPLGRKTLSRILRVTEGTVRSIIIRLKGQGYITVDKTGVGITSEGSLEFQRRLEKMNIESVRDFPCEGLNIGPSSMAILIRGVVHRGTSCLEERDQAVRAGALGAVTIIYGNGVYTMPGVYGNLEVEAPEWYRAISNTFKQPEGEACIVVVFGENRWIAVEAAFSVAVKMATTSQTNYASN
ncbi:hypothetical protein KEJ25_07795 [Candidatus Bathyarchaeota archaeon]|nr:hypothetical protein [Candidatus Bathyarchaeota archaeon]